MTRHHTQAMRAIILHTHGGPEQLVPAEIPDPTPLPDEVVVDLTAAALNRRDVWQRGATGNDGAVLGSDGAGRVSALGSDVTGIAVGDEVVINPSVGWGDAEDAPAEGWAILGIPRQGTYAERIAIPAADVRPRPQELTWHESAALPLAGLTAWRALVTRGCVQPGMRVLVTGAGGGAATFLVQIARAHGAEVTVTSSSDHKIARAIELGAAHGVRYTDPGWPAQVGEVDLVVDSAGAPAWPGALDCLRRGGTLVSFGRTGGVSTELEIPRLFYGQWNLLGTTMGSPREFDQLLAHVRQARWRPVVDSVYPLDDAAAAHARLEQPDRFGKVVLECRST
ncbi:MAG TPA: zinc-binding dehydrogenase [Gaiellales bacterium]|jgi:NADPH:quinone reductase-like Zn-dependent oxidoreductase|nr:zinc-binding dehydrogenase [Gaiellales bacterium]